MPKKDVSNKELLAALQKGGTRFYPGDISVARAKDDGAAADDGGEDRQYEILFATPKPLKRVLFNDFFIEETLSHADGAIDMRRVNGGAPFLFNHNKDAIIGAVVERSAKQDMTGCRCKIRFGKSARAREMQADVDAGIMRGVSVGYDVHEAKIERVKNDEDITIGVRVKINKWEPTEISLATVPADTKTKFERSLTDWLDETQGGEQMPDNENENHDTPPTGGTRDKDTPPVVLPGDSEEDREKLQAASVSTERARISGIESAAALAKDLVPTADLQAMRRKAIDDGTDIGAFQTALVAKAEETAKTNPMRANPNDKLDLSDGEKSKYSICRAIGYSMGWLKRDEAGFEVECAEEIFKRREKGGYQASRKHGDRTKAIAVPLDMLAPPSGEEMQGTRAIGTANTGSLVGNILRPEYYIEQLRDMALVLQAGVSVISGLTGNIQIPRKLTAGTFSFKALAANTGDNNITFDQVPLSLKTASGGIAFSRDLIIQATPSIEAIVYEDLAKGAALLVDDAVLAGTGATNNPRGIRNTTGTNTTTWTNGTDPTWDTVLTMEADIEGDNALMGNLNYFMTPALKKRLRAEEKASGYPVYVMEGRESLNGYPVKCKTTSLGSDIVFGNFREVLLGVWGFLELQRDTAELSQSGGVVVRAFVDIDVAVRHAVSFAVASEAS